jgi:transposase
MPRREELNDEQWKVIEPLLLKPQRRTDGRGRPRKDDRQVLNGILWILRSGAAWQDLRNAFRHTRPATGDSSTGLTVVYSGKYSKRWPRICESAASWTWRNASSTAPL